jgi:precorrin-2 dehydrogenase/sirohydrochlorin ferrochelatase
MTADYAKPYYPVFLDLAGRLCVIVGGGAVALRKARTLADYGADVVVIAPDVSEELIEMQADGLVTVEQRGYVRGDLEQAFLAVCATDSEEVNRAVHAEAEERRCLVNVVDVPELCSFIVPSVVRRGGLQIAISTGGAAPAVAKRLRKRFSSELGEEWGDYVTLMGEVRELVIERVPGGEAARKPIFERIADSDLLERMGRGERPSAKKVFREFAGDPEAGAASAEGTAATAKKARGA